MQQILGQAIDCDSAKCNASDIQVDQVLIPIVQVESGAKIIGSPVKTNCSILDSFIGNLSVKRLSDMLSSSVYVKTFGSKTTYPSCTILHNFLPKALK